MNILSFRKIEWNEVFFRHGVALEIGLTCSS
jgi:hypothetical protein